MKRLILLVTLIFVCIPSISFAKENDENKSIGSKYVVTPVFTKNQNPKQAGRFQLSLKNDSKYKLSFRVRNNSNKEITLSTQKLNAITGIGGSIDFTKNAEVNKFTDSKYAVSPLLTIGNIITLKAHEEKIIPFELETKDLNKGTYLGAISFKEKNTSTAANKKNEGKQNTSIETKYEIEKILPIEFNIGKVDDQVINESTLKSLIKDVKQENGNLKIDIENDNALLINGGKINVSVLENHKKVFSYESVLQMSPKTKTTLQIPWNGKVSSGKYKAVIDTKVGNVSSEKEVSFSINKKELKQLKEKKYEDNKIIVENNHSIYLYSALIVGSIILIFLVLIIYKQKNAMKRLRDKEIDS